MFSAFFQNRTVQLVDPGVPIFLQELARRGLKATALTAWWTGPFGHIPRMEALRFRDLNALGLSFDKLSPFKGARLFSKLQTAKSGPPLSSQGILLTAVADKGAVLQEALKFSKHTFTTIIFVDDRLENLKSVEQRCASAGWMFLGIHLTQRADAPLPKLDKATEKARFKHLEKTGEWLQGNLPVDSTR